MPAIAAESLSRVFARGRRTLGQRLRGQHDRRERFVAVDGIDLEVAQGSAASHLLLALRALPAVLVAELAMVGVAYLMSSVVLLLKEPNVVVDVSSFLFQIASGVNFPLTVLPGAAASACLLLPTTHALDLLRVAGLGTRPLAPPGLEIAALAVITAILLPLGAWVFSRTERRVRDRGSLGQY